MCYPSFNQVWLIDWLIDWLSWTGDYLHCNRTVKSPPFVVRESIETSPRYLMLVFFRNMPLWLVKALHTYLGSNFPPGCRWEVIDFYLILVSLFILSLFLVLFCPPLELRNRSSHEPFPLAARLSPDPTRANATHIRDRPFFSGEGRQVGTIFWGIKFCLPSGCPWIYLVATTCAKIFKVKHRTWIVESLCSIFFPWTSGKFFSAVFAVQEFFCLEIARPPHNRQKKMMVRP